VGQGRWVGAPAGCKQHGHVWTQLRNAFVGTWRAESVTWHNGLRDKRLYFVGPPFSVFFSYARLALIESLWWVWLLSHIYLLKLQLGAVLSETAQGNEVEYI